MNTCYIIHRLYNPKKLNQIFRILKFSYLVVFLYHITENFNTPTILSSFNPQQCWNLSDWSDNSFSLFFYVITSIKSMKRWLHLRKVLCYVCHHVLPARWYKGYSVDGRSVGCTRDTRWGEALRQEDSSVWRTRELFITTTIAAKKLINSCILRIWLAI